MSDLNSYSGATTLDKNNIKSLIDNFASFQWREIDSFDTYGCFIINGGSDLKWVNSGEISNEYSSPMYSDQPGALLGVSFKTRKLSFKLGVYAITQQEYRKFLVWLNPQIISRLSFSYDDDYYYEAKLSSIGESVKRVIGFTNILGKSEPLYYVELTISFELQGENVAWGRKLITWARDNEINNIYSRSSSDDNKSDLRNSFKITINMGTNIAVNDTIQATAYLTNDSSNIGNSNIPSLLLFDLVFNKSVPLNFTYDSETGIITWGDNQEILNLKTINTDGDYIVKSYYTEKMLLPGLLTDELVYYPNNNISNDIYIQITSSISGLSDYVSFTNYKKTNII